MTEFQPGKEVTVLLINSLLQPGAHGISRGGVDYSFSLTAHGTWTDLLAMSEENQAGRGTVTPAAPAALPLAIVVGPAPAPADENIRSAVKALREAFSCAYLFFESVPLADEQVPLVQDWQSRSAGELRHYNSSSFYNIALHNLSTHLGFWILDCDRALARRGTMCAAESGRQAILLEELILIFEDGSLWDPRRALPQKGG